MCPVMDSRVPVPVVSVISRNVEIQRKVGNGDSQLAPLEVISSLVTRLLWTAQEGRLAEVKVHPEEGMGSSSAVTVVVGVEKYHSVMERTMVCFSCGRPGHGVNRCSQVDGGCPEWPIAISSDMDRNVTTPGNEG